MSKSAENELSRINITDSPEIIANKVSVLPLTARALYFRQMLA